MKYLVVLCCAVLGCNVLSARQERRFSDDFIFGAATASYQIEGGWDADGKGENIWDRMTHTRPEVIRDQSNGDIAADSYNNYKRDVEMMRELGLDAYRFSLSWSRILPEGFANNINEAGITFYNNYIDEMLKYNITPMATLYHWDLPQKLQDLGGLANPLFTEWFEDYARVVFANFGDRVKLWLTFNEPREICYEGYGSTTKAPILNSTASATYICAKNLVTAHARAYYAYDREFRPSQGGRCGITISFASFQPETDTEEDHFAAEVLKQAQYGIYSEPIFGKEGGFPKEFASIIAQKSAEQGYPRSRLPEFTDEEREFVRGSSDFLGMNHYSEVVVSATQHLGNPVVPSVDDDTGVGSYQPQEWPASASSWLRMKPDSIYNALMDLKQRYDNPEIYITENGWSTEAGLEDEGRVTYYKLLLDSVLRAIEDGVDVRGYMAWSLMDNFEWMEGYLERFGLYEVDFTDPARTRTPRKSAFVYKQIVKTRVIDPDYEPDTRVMTIDDGY